MDDQLATRQDLAELATKGDIARLEGEIKPVKWMLAVVIAVTVLPALQHFIAG
ncbi:MAG: hypothetical protein H7835_03120 [Magnetococcus sp. XQGC-1]